MVFLSPAQLLLAIAEREPLEATLAAFPGLGLGDAQKLLRGAAAALQREAAQTAPASSKPAPAPRSKPPGLAMSKLAPVAKRAPAPKSKPPAPHASSAEAGPAGTLPETGKGLGKVRVFSDGAARGNPGPAGAGAVVLDERGQILGSYGKFLGRQTNNVAEYEGLLLGLRHAKALGAREVEVRADSELMIRQLEGRYRVKNAGLAPLHKEALRLLRTFERHGLRHVPRADNALADEMSNRAIDEKL